MKRPLNNTRTFREAAGETALFSIIFIDLASVPFWFIALAHGRETAFHAVSDAGGVLLEHVGWALSGYIAVLLGFYVVVIGGQILGGGDSEARVRRVLGAVAELMAAAAILLVVMVAAYCVEEPGEWALFVAAGPTVLVVFFLAVQLGRFLISSPEFRLAEARRTRAASRARLRATGVRSRRRFVRMWGATSVVAAVLATAAVAVAAPGLAEAGLSAVPTILYIAGSFLLVAAGLIGWNAFALVTATLDQSVFSRVMFVVMTVWLYASVFAVCWRLVADGLGWLGWPLAAAAALTAALPAVSPGRSKGWRADWSFRGAVNRLVAQRLARSYAKAVREIGELTPTHRERDAAPSTLRRLVDVLRTRPATGG